MTLENSIRLGECDGSCSCSGLDLENPLFHIDCDGSCSSLDFVSQLKSHEEIKAQFKKSIKSINKFSRRTLSFRYTFFMDNLKQNHPTTYKVLRKIGVPYSI